MTYHAQFLLLVLAGWVNRQQQDVIDYHTTATTDSASAEVGLTNWGSPGYSDSSANPQ